MGRIIKVKKGDTTYSIKLYDTEAETGTSGAIYGTLKLRIDGANHYASLTRRAAQAGSNGAAAVWSTRTC